MPKPSKPERCSTGACVKIKPDGEQFLFTSTLGEDRGSTRYDRVEVERFIFDVKAGKWDHLIA